MNYVPHSNIAPKIHKAKLRQLQEETDIYNESRRFYLTVSEPGPADKNYLGYRKFVQHYIKPDLIGI